MFLIRYFIEFFHKWNSYYNEVRMFSNFKFYVSFASLRTTFFLQWFTWKRNSAAQCLCFLARSPTAKLRLKSSGVVVSARRARHIIARKVLWWKISRTSSVSKRSSRNWWVKRSRRPEEWVVLRGWISCLCEMRSFYVTEHSKQRFVYHTRIIHKFIGNI